MNQEIALLPATELVRLYRSGQLSPVEATRAALDRIRTVDAAINAYCLVDEQGALKAARASERRWRRLEPAGLVDGVPTGIKDLVLTRGWPTLRGSRTTLADQAWDEDAPATARLREHGAVLLGKTTTPEFGWKGVTDSKLTGITRNPWNSDMTPGGSSGGAAAALATGMGALHIGTDGGGSIRIPAGFTGVFGHKPSFGRVPAYPLSPFGTVAHVGPMTRTVADAALMLTVISQPDARDWFALPFDGRDFRLGLEEGVNRLRIAFSVDLGYVKVDPEVAALVRQAVDVFRHLGAHVEEVPAPFTHPGEIFRTHWYAGAAAVIGSLPAARRRKIDPGLLGIARQGAEMTLKEYLTAVQQRGQLGQTMNRFMRDWDLLLTPTLPIPAFPAGRNVPEPDQSHGWVDWTPFTYPFNLTQQPACSVPCGLTRAGLPVGMQIVGRMHDDARVLRAARAFESVRPFPMPQTA